MRAALELGRLRRIVLGDGAPATLLPLGTAMWMGRGSLDTCVPVWHELSLAAWTWVERSDRDDPRWSTPATGAVATHAGADLTASWRFRRL